MHSLVSRVNNVSALLSSCTMALLALIAFSSFVSIADPKGDLGIVSVKLQAAKGRRYPFAKQDSVNVNFNVTADLSPLFNWNTKQLFVYLEADYVNSNGGSNNVVIWDKIIQRKEDAHLSLVGRNKYTFREISKTFKSLEPSHYSLKYNVMPYVGVLTYGEAARTVEPVAFPVKVKPSQS